MCLRVYVCCYCFSLQTGVTLIAILEIFRGLFTFATGLWAIGHPANNIAYTGGIFFIVYGVLACICGGVLLSGIFAENEKCVACAIYFFFLELLCLIAQSIIFIVVGLSRTENEKYIYLSFGVAILVIWIPLQFYFIIVLYSYYGELVEDESSSDGY